MVARSSEARRWCRTRSRRWRKRRWGRRRRRGNWFAQVRTTARTSGTRVSRFGPARVLLGAACSQTGYPGHSTLLRTGIVAEPKPFGTSRLPGRLSRPGRRRRGESAGKFSFRRYILDRGSRSGVSQGDMSTRLIWLSVIFFNVATKGAAVCTVSSDFS